MTLSTDFFKGLKDWQKITSSNKQKNYVVYAGNDQINHSDGLVYRGKICIISTTLFTHKKNQDLKIKIS